MISAVKRQIFDSGSLETTSGSFFVIDQFEGKFVWQLVRLFVVLIPITFLFRCNPFSEWYSLFILLRVAAIDFLIYKPGGCLWSGASHRSHRQCLRTEVLLYSSPVVWNPTHPMQNMGLSLKRTRLQVHRLTHRNAFAFVRLGRINLPKTYGG